MIKYAKKDNFYSIFPMGEIPNDWEELTKEEYDKHFEKTLDELKSEKLAELTAITSKFSNQLVNTDMVINSSLGFRVNADPKSIDNIDSLISIGDEITQFMDYDNELHELSVDDLKVIKLEIQKNGCNLYKQKWDMRSRILNAKTLDELNFEIKFEMKDFS